VPDIENWGGYGEARVLRPGMGEVIGEGTAS